jgi:hypothetical protein
MNVKKTEFWSVFYYGSTQSVCSRHKTQQAAFEAAAKCERRGGAKHRIVEANYLDDPRKGK